MGNPPQYRFWLTAIVGSSILLTLGGESYYGSDGKTMKQRSDVMKMASKASTVPTGCVAETSSTHTHTRILTIRFLCARVCFLWTAQKLN